MNRKATTRQQKATPQPAAVVTDQHLIVLEQLWPDLSQRERYDLVEAAKEQVAARRRVVGAPTPCYQKDCARPALWPNGRCEDHLHEWLRVMVESHLYIVLACRDRDPGLELAQEFAAAIQDVCLEFNEREPAPQQARRERPPSELRVVAFTPPPTDAPDVGA